MIHTTLKWNDKDFRLIVEVKARIDWIAPPATTQEGILREVASAEAQRAASEIEDAVRLIVALMLARR